MRVGLVGAGGIADVHLPGWLSLGAEVSVFATGGALELVARHGGRVVDTLEELLASCTIVDVCTPTPTHPEIVRAAAVAGRHVVCEKPLALTAVAAAEMVEVCRTAGVHLYPAHVVRYFEAYAALQRAVAAGEIGDVVVQRFSRTGSRPAPSWFSDDEQSGGNVTDQSIHDLDFARWTAGEVTTAYAQEAADGPVRSVQVVLSHAGGALSYVTGTWGRPGTTFRTTVEIAGTTGLLRHDSREHPELVVDRGFDDGATEGRGLLPGLGFGESPYRSELRELAAAILGGRVARVTADDGVRAVAIAEAARRSLASGRSEPVHDPWADSA